MDMDKQPHIESRWAPSFKITRLDMSTLIFKRAQMLRMLLTRNLLSNPSCTSMAFKFVNIDASNTQLGGVIVQEGKPISFYSRKLTPP